MLRRVAEDGDLPVGVVVELKELLLQRALGPTRVLGSGV